MPTLHQVLLARAASDYPAASPPPLRVIRSCSSALAPATLERVEAAFHAPVLEAYAMTEAAHQMTSNPLPKHGEHKPGTVGRAQGSGERGWLRVWGAAGCVCGCSFVGGWVGWRVAVVGGQAGGGFGSACELRAHHPPTSAPPPLTPVKLAILDAQCALLPPGATGEVCILGPNVTSGYRNNEAANKEAFAGGWVGWVCGQVGWVCGLCLWAGGSWAGFLLRTFAGGRP